MESKESEITFAELGISNRVSAIIRRFKTPLENPLLFLFLVFFSYLLVDVVSTLILVGEIEEWYIPLIHFLLGFLMIAIYFSRILPDFFHRKRRAVAAISLLFIVMGFIGIKSVVFDLSVDDSVFSKAYLVNEFLWMFHFLAITSAVWIMYENLALKRKKFEIEMSHERLKIEHRSLQLSPHFLMNVLTLFASKMLKLSPPLFIEFSHLSALLRYAIKEFGHPNSLKGEIDAVNHYLEIQRFRFRDVSMALTFAVDRDIADVLPMPRMCLLTLVENVFFHGDYMDSENPCRMEFVLSGDGSGRWNFRMSISNKVLKSDVKVRSGFGASAVFRVLGNEFGERFHYSVDSDELTYLLQMTIDYGTGIQSRTD
jgi:hypothetical protein